MSVSIIMAGALWRDLNARGVKSLDLGHCEAIVARMLDCVHSIERATRDDETPPRRCETGEIDLDGACMVCGAWQGEACRQLAGC
ncbi:hypothetical protein XI09_42380 [Bradyrhizobium sp. CCBAU 11386]|uniref:hypothetical protein n=1 Tax=Bradyrhizobium sp. CCBAU 11386 TaxID=1630837 RepID=UPI0023040724|nr:hypothetical protein [Bradyrhizobium sp. CCBAU 11386]MDA9511189.1 hypothetical protein [Bradyrhizobium sp. CCBAU 11386]